MEKNTEKKRKRTLSNQMARKACVHCKKSHRKCNDERPCNNCVKSKKECYDVENKYRKNVMPPTVIKNEKKTESNKGKKKNTASNRGEKKIINKNNNNAVFGQQGICENNYFDGGELNQEADDKFMQLINIMVDESKIIDEMEEKKIHSTASNLHINAHTDPLVNLRCHEEFINLPSPTTKEEYTPNNNHYASSDPITENNSLPPLPTIPLDINKNLIPNKENLLKHIQPQMGVGNQLPSLILPNKEINNQTLSKEKSISFNN